MGKKDRKKTAIKRVIKNKPKQKPKKKRQKITPTHGRAVITATFNNTIITFTDLQGHTLAWSSTGRVGFKGTRKSTPFAATKAAEAVVSRIKDVLINGPGMGRGAAVRVIKNSGLKIVSLADVTPVPHNGCRPKGRRRV